ncbi:carbohydrate ABC transporter permease [Anaerocolumna sedimenticola]|uniref:Carbohydrate ABC transporter permease n=1 Tax=Anaerocolumna sedimenticola TaxID=2696063 RepID=A0A6P1THL3_9FIRM|nr:carbohydrate ABC transporter permease [Anaerocolumna sedimenticola]QHQ60710.1 carbohydrate ABC transporter permease [Anaerocolumna sedimenticola]
MSNRKINHGRRMSKDTLAVNVLGYVMIGLFALICVIPFYLIIVASFTPEASLIRNGYPLILTEFSVQSYLLCLKNPLSILKAYGTTIGVTAAGTVLSVFVASMTGYVLSRKDFPWRNKLSFFFFFTTLFNGGLVPWYMMCIRYLNFKNSYLGVLLPLMFSVWNMIIAKSFMNGIPNAISESAKMDRANDFVIFTRLILPLSKPLLATLSLFSALAYWNDWYNCMLYITNENMFTLQYYLQRILGSAEAMRLVAEKSGIALPSVPLESMKMAMTVIATGPIVLLYPFVQRYFVKGLTIGSVKG